MKKNYWDWIYFGWMTILPILSSLESSYFVYQFADFFASQPLLNLIFIYLGLAFAMGLAMIPTTMVSLLSGYLFGFQSLPIVIISYLIASIIGFLLGKLIQPKSIYTLLEKKQFIHQIHHSIENQSFKWIFLMRLSPVLPFALSNAYLSLLKIPFRSYIFGSAIGMLPRTLLAVWSGTEIKNIEIMLEGENPLSLQNYLSLSLFFLSLIGFFALIKKNIKQP